MSFNWTVSDPRYRQEQAWKYETFRGYFTDIQRAARKSLPRKPSKDLCSLLGLTLTPREQPGAGDVTSPVGNKLRRTSSTAASGPIAGSKLRRASSTSAAHSSISAPPTDLVPVFSDNAGKHTPNVSTGGKGKSNAGHLKDILLCKSSDEEDGSCTKREKTVACVAIYFAIIVFLLLLVVVVLSVTLSRTADDGAASARSKDPSQTTHETLPETTETSPTDKPTTQKTTDRQGTTVSATQAPATTTETEVTTKEDTKSTTEESQPPTTAKSTTELSTETSKDTDTSGPTTVTIPKTSESTTTPLQNSSQTQPSTKLPNSTPSTSATTAEPTSSGTSITTETPSNTTDGPTQQTTLKSTELPTQPTTANLTTVSQQPTSEVTTASQKTTPTSTDVTGVTSEKTVVTSRPPTSATDTTKVTTIQSTADTTKVTTIPPTAGTTIDPEMLPKIEPQTVKPGCTTSVCNSARSTISRVDFDTSPCWNFYKFACGEWIKNKRSAIAANTKNVPMSFQKDMKQMLYLQIQELLAAPYRQTESFAQRLTKRLYQSCIQSNIDDNLALGLQELHTFLDPLGMDPGGDISSSLSNMLLSAISNLQVTPFFKLTYHTITGDDGTSKYAMKLEPPTLYLDNSIYTEPLDGNEPAVTYIDGVTLVLYSYLESFGLDSGAKRRKRQLSDLPSYDDVYQLVLRAYKVDVQIAKMVADHVISGDGSTAPRSTVPMSYLKTSYPEFPWTSATSVQQDAILVEIVDEMFFYELHNWFSSINDVDLKLYTFITVLVQRVWMYMPFVLRDDLVNIGRHGDLKYTEIDCVDLTLRLANEEVHSVYITQYTTTVLDNRLTLTNLEKDINTAFQKRVSNSDWIQSDLVRVVTTLAKNTKLHFSPLRSNVRETVGITGSDQSLLSLAVELHRQNHMLMVNRLGENLTQVDMDWTSTRTHYDAKLNTLGLPTGLTVYIQRGDPEFHSHAFIGMLMAEEFIQILTGPLNGGVPAQWWTTQNVVEFNAISTCFSDQLTQIQNTYYDVGEVMKQNGAFQLAYEAYSTTTTTADQTIKGTSISQQTLFFINSAQLYCHVDDFAISNTLSKLRTNDMLKNNVAFETIFSCPNSSPMVPNNTCELL